MSPSALVALERRSLYTATINKIERESLALMRKRYTLLKMHYRKLLLPSYLDRLKGIQAAWSEVRLSGEQAAL